VKVWWEEDGCFYPGVVRDTREEDPERDDGAESNNAKSNASLSEEDKLVAGEKRPLQKAVKIVYPYDSVEEWIPFHSRNLYWIHHQIEVGIPRTCFSFAETGEEELKLRRYYNKNKTATATSSALGWRVGINGCQYGYVTNTTVVHSPTTDDSSTKDVKLQILLDSGHLCSKETKMAHSSRLVIQKRDANKEQEQEQLPLVDNILWFQPPQVNFDLFHQLQRAQNMKEDQNPNDEETVTAGGGGGDPSDVSVQVTYWDPSDGFQPKLVRLSWRFSVFRLCFRVMAQDRDEVKGEELLQYLCTPAVSGLDQGTKKLDLRESMIQWPVEVFNNPPEHHQQQPSVEESEDESVVRKESSNLLQYYLFGSSFAFAGHSIQSMAPRISHREKMPVGSRVLVTELVLDLPSSSFLCRSGIIMSNEIDCSPGWFDVLFDSSNGSSERVPLFGESESDKGTISKKKYYVDVLGRAGALECTSSCLPFMLPIVSGLLEGHFIPSRGLVLCKGYGMSPRDFVNLGGGGASASETGSSNDSNKSALDAIKVKDCKKTVYHQVSGFDPISGKQARVTLAYWLNIHKISFSKTVYWKLCSQSKSGSSGPVNLALQEPLVEAWKPGSRPQAQEKDKADAGGDGGDARNNALLFGTNTSHQGMEKKIQKLKCELFEEGIIEDSVLSLLFEEWVEANKAKFSFTACDRTLTGDLNKVDQMYQQCKLSGKKVNLRLGARKGSGLQWYHLLFKQAHEALDLIKDYLQNFAEVQTENLEDGRSKMVTFDQLANEYYQSIDAIDLLTDLIRYAKTKPTRPSSLASFERKGSVFQYFFWFVQSIFKVLTICTGRGNNGWLEYLDVSNDGTISGNQGSKVQRKRKRKPAIAKTTKTPNGGMNRWNGSALAQQKQKEKRAKEKDERRTAEVQKYQKELDALMKLFSDHLSESPAELARIKKYIENQSHFFGLVPERLPLEEEKRVLQHYYLKLMERGPSAKSTSINWLLRYFSNYKFTNDFDYEEMRKLTPIAMILGFLNWVVEVHMPTEKTPPSFFKYKAYFPYFWAYARGDFVGNLLKEKKRFHAGTTNKAVAPAEQQDDHNNDGPSDVQELEIETTAPPPPADGDDSDPGQSSKGKAEIGADPLQPQPRKLQKTANGQALFALISTKPEMTFREVAPIFRAFLPITDEELQNIVKHDSQNGLLVTQLLDGSTDFKHGYLSEFNLSAETEAALFDCLLDAQDLFIRRPLLRRDHQATQKRPAETVSPAKKEKKRVRRTLDQILKRPVESLGEEKRPTCLGCKAPCAVHRRDQKTGVVISWRCRNCGWQGMKAQLQMSSLQKPSKDFSYKCQDTRQDSQGQG
jgi:hypothetical protein